MLPRGFLVLSNQTKIHSIMKKEFSGDYLAPEIEVIDLMAQSVLCQSGRIPGLTNDDEPYTF